MSRGLLLVGHGSHLSPDSSAPVRQHAASIRKLGLFEEVRMGFWKEEPGLSRALDAFGARDITIVPVFISAGYFTNEVIPREMGLAGEVTELRGMRLRYTPPIGSHPALAKVIIQRALEAGARPGDALAVLGHGTPRNPDSERNVLEQTERARVLGPFAEVVTVFLDQEPNMDRVLELTKAETVVVVPLFVADGWHVGETIPADLALDGPETRRGGRRLRYAGAVGTHPSVVDVILELAGCGDGAARVSEPDRVAGDRPAGAPRVSERERDTDDPPARAARVSERERVVDRGPGSPARVRERAWGLFRIHRDEQGLILCSLAHNGEHLRGDEIRLDDVADRCRFDDLGRYRPLSGALTVPTGWYARFERREEVERILGDLYPLGAEHWQQWDEGTLRIVGLDAVLERQTGRYAVARDLSHDGREAARWALCDARCDRVPVWAEGEYARYDLDPYAADDDFLVTDGKAPCPEPCSVFVSLCREAALWEKEQPAPKPVDESVPWAAFDVPGNEVREEYLALRFGGTVPSDG